ncbi:MAG: FAD binding domain-containing protein [Candidatus Levyibacteriota bacterium]
MKPAAFRYHRPPTLAAALALLAEHGGEAKVLAGGQSLVPMMNMRLAQPAELIDLNDIGELAHIGLAQDAIEIGALARHRDVAGSALVRERCPLLAEAAASIGHDAIRNRGTLGGSLAHADPVAQLPLVAVTLDARIDIAGAGRRRSLPARELFVSVMTTALEPDEMIVAARFPLLAPGEGQAFRAFERRRGDFAIVSVAVSVTLAGGRVGALRLGIGGVGPVPQALDELALAARGEVADPDWARRLAGAARSAVAPDDDPRIPAEFRRELVEVLVARATADALARARENR